MPAWQPPPVYNDEAEHEGHPYRWRKVGEPECARRKEVRVLPSRPCFRDWDREPETIYRGAQVLSIEHSDGSDTRRFDFP